MAQRDHAAADHGQGRAAALRRLSAPLAGCGGACRRRARRGSRRLGRAWLLRQGAEPARLRPRGGEALRRQLSRRPKPSSAPFQASATILPRRSLPLPSARGRRPSTAISSAWWLGLSPSPRRLPAAKAEIRTLALGLTPAERAGDFAQAMMDLGATLCSPRRPACGLCPLVSGCEAHAQGLAEVLPYREEKAERPTRRGHAFVALRDDGAVLLRERPLKGLLGGMLETPSSPWTEGAWHELELDHAPLRAEWREVPGLVEHTFTHFHLELAVYLAEVSAEAKLDQGRAAGALPLGPCPRSSQRGAAERDAESARPRLGG